MFPHLPHHRDLSYVFNCRSGVISLQLVSTIPRRRVSSQFVANPNGQHMEEECIDNYEQTTTTPGNEETVEEIFCESSLEDPLGEHFDQFGGDLDLDKLLEHVETFNETGLVDPLGERFDQFGGDLHLDKLLEHVEIFSEQSIEDPLGECFDQMDVTWILTSSSSKLRCLVSQV